jgi:hypothetical protein
MTIQVDSTARIWLTVSCTKSVIQAYVGPGVFLKNN